MPVQNQDLPYDVAHLEPVISSRTVEFHYGKHQEGYANKLAELILNTQFEDMDLVSIIKETAFDKDKAAIYNNAAQLWNHIFYWAGLKAEESADNIPNGLFLDAIKKTFGGEDAFKKELEDAAVSIFGSGWAWLALEPEAGILSIIKTQNAGNPLSMDLVPLFTIDVWEHAYYLDYQNRRADYVKGVVEKLADWNAVMERYNSAME